MVVIEIWLFQDNQIVSETSLQQDYKQDTTNQRYWWRTGTSTFKFTTTTVLALTTAEINASLMVEKPVLESWRWTGFGCFWMVG
jgi:nuclear transport factor 2 (NTF2) superfamily protein